MWRIKGLLFKLKRIGLHNAAAALFSGLWFVSPKKFLKTFHNQSLNALCGIPTPLFTIDVTDRNYSLLPAMTNRIKIICVYSNSAKPKYITHPKFPNIGKYLISEEQKVVELCNVKVQIKNMAIFISEYFGPSTKTVGIVNGKEGSVTVDQAIKLFKRTKTLIREPIILYKTRRDQNFFHFLTQQVPSTLLALQHCKEAGIRASILRPKTLSTFEVEFLSTLGVPIVTELNSIVQASLVVLPRVGDATIIHESDLGLIQYWKDNLRDTVQQHKPTFSTRVFISRSKSTRYSLNDELIEKFIKTIGFSIINTEKMALLDQIEIFSKCQVLVAPHGAGMANMVFMQPGSKIVELNTAGFVNIFVKSLSSVCGHSYSFVDVEKLGANDSITRLLAELKV